MKRIMKLWNVILLSVLGVLGSSCLFDPDTVEPCYGVPAIENTVENGQNENPESPQEAVNPSSQEN